MATLTLFDSTPTGAADISPDGLYRYCLERVVGRDDRQLNFVMINPSKADAIDNDPTINRCIGYARAWGFGRLTVTNLFALRSTDPKGLATVADPVGPANDAYLRLEAIKADLVICAWGSAAKVPPAWRHRPAAVLDLLIAAGARPHALKLTSAGDPCHPLYLKADLVPFPFGA